MNPLKKLFESTRTHFSGSGKFKALAPLFEAVETVFFLPSHRTRHRPFVRDSLDLKRFMTFVILSLLPVLFFGIYNTGLQAGLAGGKAYTVSQAFLPGLTYVLPILIVTYAVGLFWEILFASIRGHQISEGFLVTGMLFPLILPPTIPLWQVALGISFGVVIGKEVFGGTGKNFLNPALTARVFLYFAYPVQISGDAVWTAVDGFSGATPLSLAASSGYTGLTEAYSWFDAFVGTIPGSMG